MPFTPAHPAIVVPLLRPARRWLSATGLILGSMSPDFEYFLRLRSGGGFGHSIVGIFLLDLPLVLLVAGLFHGLVKRPLVRSLPALWRQRLGRLAEQPWPLRNLWSLRLLLGAVVGGASHLLWDGVTHGRGRIAPHLPFLSVEVGGLPVFAWFQFASSALGLWVLARFIWQLPVARQLPPVSARRQRLFWQLAGSVAAVFLLLFLVTSPRYYHMDRITSVVVRVLSAGMLGVLLAAAYLNFTRSEPTDNQPDYSRS